MEKITQSTEIGTWNASFQRSTPWCEHIPVNCLDNILDTFNNIYSFTQHVFIKHILCLGTFQQNTRHGKYPQVIDKVLLWILQMPLTIKHLSALYTDVTEVKTAPGTFQNIVCTEIWLSGIVFLGVSYSKHLNDAFFQFFLPSILKAM